MSKHAYNARKWERPPHDEAPVQMTAGQYATALGELGITHRQAAKLFSIMRRQSRDYASGRARVPGPVARLIAVMYVYGIGPADVLAVAATINGEGIGPVLEEGDDGDVE